MLKIEKLTKKFGGLAAVNDVSTVIEAGKVEQGRRLRGPKAQGVRPTPMPPNNRHVIGLGNDLFCRRPDGFAIDDLDRALETDLITHFGPLEFPGVALLQPILGDAPALGEVER